jgi:hypothetical protein
MAAPGTGPSPSGTVGVATPGTGSSLSGPSRVAGTGPSLPGQSCAASPGTGSSPSGTVGVAARGTGPSLSSQSCAASPGTGPSPGDPSGVVQPGTGSRPGDPSCVTSPLAGPAPVGSSRTRPPNVGRSSPGPSETASLRTGHDPSGQACVVSRAELGSTASSSESSSAVAPGRGAVSDVRSSSSPGSHGGGMPHWLAVADGGGAGDGAPLSVRDAVSLAIWGEVPTPRGGRAEPDGSALTGDQVGDHHGKRAIDPWCEGADAFGTAV